MHAFNRIAAVAVALGAALTAHATVTTTSNSGLITAFQAGSGTEVINFDNLTGISVTAYPAAGSPGPDVPAGSQANSITGSGGSLVFFNSGGASFNNPSGNPGVPIGIINPDGGIAADVRSQDNVAAGLVVDPLDSSKPPKAFTDGAATAFMEVIFPKNMSKVGVFVAHGTALMILKDENNSNLAVGDVTVTGNSGQFIGIERASADVRGVTFIFTGPTTIDDFTFGAPSSSNGNGNGNTGGGGSSVPDTTGPLTLVLAAGFLFLARRKFAAHQA